MKKEAWKNFWKKFWFIVWKDNSVKGWIISLLFIFVVIKFIFFPLLNLVTGTSLPLVIVESCSMYHDGNILSNFDEWWDRHDFKYFAFKIGKDNFIKYPFSNGFNKGDILFVTGTKPEKIEIGDVVIFEANQAHPVIHRVIGITQEENKYTFSTIGDNNEAQLLTERSIPQEKVIGKAQANILPYIGWIKLIFFEHPKPESQRGFCTEN